MNETRRARHAPVRRLASLCILLVVGGGALADPPANVIDSQRIIQSLKTAPAAHTRSLVVEARPATPATQKISLDIRFANDSDRLTDAAHTQLAELGTALSSAELAQTHFMIAGHTSATGAADHNQRLSESRARAVRSYLVAHFHIEPQRLSSVGYGAAQPLPDYPPTALEQRRVEISTVPAAF
ncbi:MAG TPA: OmpA family protein [Steroidobacteraceae bacterium]|jgi:outer membrane protein OmpA-like peptidoglycan-associated protein|nr:OmpA family protein [Steroidobacteraceae bacterium]